MGDAPKVSRFESLDVLKGFIILAVVFAHLLVSSTGSESGRADSIVLQILYLGLMSFFLISGYFYRPDRGFVANMRKRGTQMVLAITVCAIVLPVITYVWLALCGQTSDPSDILGAFIRAMQLDELFEPLGPTYDYIACAFSVGYYYIWVMIGGFIVFYALADRVMDDVRKLAAVLVILIAVFMLDVEFWPVKLPFYFNLAPLAAVFMFAGAFMAKVRFVEKVEGFEWKTLGFWKPFLLCLVIGVVLCLILPPGTKFDWAYFGEYGGLSVIPYIIESVCMFVVFVYIAKFVAKVPVLSKLLDVAGQHTLGIILLHGFVATLICALFYTIPTTCWFPPEMGLVNRIALAVAVTTICLVVCIFGPKLVRRARGAGKKTGDRSGSDE